MLVGTARSDLRPVLAYVAHGLRGPADDRREAERVGDLARVLGVAHVVLDVEVRRNGEGMEAEARRARHAALEAEAARRGAVCVLLAHHAEDQAETLLLRLARGAGVDGLRGMSPVAGLRVRPLLDVRRADLHRTADEVAPGTMASAAHDPMNDDVTVARVRLRTDVIPALAQVGPDPVAALARLAALARDEAELLDGLVEPLRAELPVVTFGPATLVPTEALRALHPALARRVLRGMLPAGTTASAATIERLRVAPDGWRATLPGPIDASVDRGWHVLRPIDGAADRPAQPDEHAHPQASDHHVLVVGEPLLHDPSGLLLRRTAAPSDATATRLMAQPSDGLPPGYSWDRLTLGIPGSAVPLGELRVRTRRDGDRLRTPVGRRQLGDVLADAGVPRALRDLVPVVVDAADAIVWVPGVAAAAAREGPAAAAARAGSGRTRE